MFEIIARSKGNGRFAAVVNGEVVVPSTTTPLFAAARVLADRGHSDETELVLKHEGSSVVSMRSTIGRSKVLTVRERPSGPVFSKFIPFGGINAEGEDDGA